MQLRRLELGERRSRISTPSQHNGNITAVKIVSRRSAAHADFCIQLLPDHMAEPAHSLFADVRRLGAGAPEDGKGEGEGGVQDMWLETLGDCASQWSKDVGGKPVTLTFVDTHHASLFRNARKPAAATLQSPGHWSCRRRQSQAACGQHARPRTRANSLETMKIC